MKLLEKYNSIMEREEGYRNKWAFGLSVSFTIIIFVSFAFYKGFLSLGSGQTLVKVKNQDQVANVLSAKSIPSPVQNTKQTFKSVFDDLGNQLNQLEESISSVLVPFVTNIEVYKRE